MILRWLPTVGPTWSPRTGYVIHNKVRVGLDIVVLGRLTTDGREHDWFIGVYDDNGDHVPGSGCRTTPNAERARDVFEAHVSSDARRRYVRTSDRRKAG